MAEDIRIPLTQTQAQIILGRRAKIEELNQQVNEFIAFAAEGAGVKQPCQVKTIDTSDPNNIAIVLTPAPTEPASDKPKKK